MIRLFLFKILFKLTWWVAPNKSRVNKIFELYLEYVKSEEDYIKCQKRQAEMDACVQPRTETYEFLPPKAKENYTLNLCLLAYLIKTSPEAITQITKKLKSTMKEISENSTKNSIYTFW